MAAVDGISQLRQRHVVARVQHQAWAFCGCESFYLALDFLRQALKARFQSFLSPRLRAQQCYAQRREARALPLLHGYEWFAEPIAPLSDQAPQVPIRQSR